MTTGSARRWRQAGARPWAAAGRVLRAVVVGGSRLIGLLLIAPIRIYQLVISPLVGPTCRFYPSCSTYAVQAIRRHGPLRGSALAGWRLLRCNPWNLGGLDPVPECRPHRHAHPAADGPTPPLSRAAQKARL